ncbi:MULTISPECIES: hypothetical protein [Peribacillus]|uniref:hypothetical protein n=1 Tax=Peribacillus TaxID=2675229 RepID=UPI001F4F0657|nr:MULTISPECIES: hypothetical protein [unclassified Peribacillus]MCK1985172.1 hypothetical protein [Peribacillus sp. Aquil_B1]MCK2007178.1 hypothetical protein [Peribacillus sp. Aquil_B8]
MALSIFEADDYVSQNVIDIEDWENADDEKKQRIINVASRTISDRYKDCVIPDEAVYEFVPKLAAVFNDTYKMQQYGVQSLSFKGIAYAFRNGEADLRSLIPATSIGLISDANGGITVSKIRWGRSVR